MGKSWDSFVPQPLFWKEVFRVLKPGGYALAFFGTRTYDWGTMAIRLAGFEIRDMICWIYGSGFPKSLDISKSIDSQKGEVRKLTRIGKEKKQGKNIKFDVRGSNERERYDIPVCKEAKEAKGLGTALKPANEPVCVARKPIEGNVATNFLKYGTGGINLDDCRIETEDSLNGGGSLTKVADGWDRPFRHDEDKTEHYKKIDAEKLAKAQDLGRFPANVIFDDIMGTELDQQTGILKSGSIKPHHNQKADSNGHKSNKVYGKYNLIDNPDIDSSEGGASRFFYCAKSSQFERNAGCEYLEAIKTNDGREVEADNAFQRGKNERNNHHPTVKPISLMRYLQRLVTPKGGITLDPFAGLGTSGCSASFEDIGEIVLMEMDETYIPIIEARTKYWSIEQNRINYLDEIKRQKQEVIENQMKLF